MIAETLSKPAKWSRMAFPRTARHLLVHWCQRHRQRVDLAELDDHLLADIGVSRQEASRECIVPFWR